MRALSRSFNFHPALSPGTYISKGAAVESDAEDVVEVPIDNETTEMEVVAPGFDLRSYTHEED